jgi:dienelactone hydrolase
VACNGAESSERPPPKPAAGAAQPGPVVPIPPAYAERAELASSTDEADGEKPVTIDALLVRPQGRGPFRAVVALHGCSGLYERDGRLSPHYDDWAVRLRDLGYVVLMPDSYNPRGVSETCRHAARPIRPNVERTKDAYAALGFLQQQTFIRYDKIGLMGWSNGAFTTLFAIAAGARARPKGLPSDFKAAIAFYPPCAKVLENEHWKTNVPLEILIGELDDWTPAAPCMALAEKVRPLGMEVETVVYKNAYHAFDSPNMPVHVIGGAGGTPSGKATVGTEPTARAEAIRRVPEILARRLGD